MFFQVGVSSKFSISTNSIYANLVNFVSSKEMGFLNPNFPFFSEGEDSLIKQQQEVDIYFAQVDLFNFGADLKSLENKTTIKLRQ